LPAHAVSPNIVISQVYGGGGNTGATLKNDFIELFNRDTTAVDVTGWSMQYASSSGSTWQVTSLSGTIQPGHYYLVQEAAGSGGSTDLPTPDATGNIAMSASNGKVALVNNSTALIGATPSDASIIDVVGYGSANFFEGSGAAPSLSNTTADLRLNDGCQDTDNNAADFASGAPNPRNTNSASYSCTGPTDPIGVGAVDPDPVVAGNTTLLTVAVTPGTNPTSTGLSVIGDLSSIGGSATQAFFDDGSNGDVAAGDNTFSFLATVDSGTSAGDKSLPVSITDDQARSSNITISLTVQAAVSPVADVVISQIYGGGGNSGATYTNDFIELYNRSGSVVDITGWSVQYASSSGTSWSVTSLSGSIASGQYYLVQEAQGSGGTTPLPTPDATGTTAMSASNGKVALVNTSTALSGSCPTSGAVDFVGYGSANCFEGSGAAPGLSNTTADLRAGDGSVDTNDNAADFTAGDPNPRNSSFGFDAAPSVTSTTPANGSADVSLNADIELTFSEPVDVSGSWFSISCSDSGSHTAVVSGGPDTFTLNPDTDFVSGETCTVSIVAADVTDQDTIDPPDNMAADYVFSFATSGPVCSTTFTPIYDIEGSGATTPLNGSVVTTQGVVVGDYEGPSPNLRGFYIQDVTGDGNPATSDGVFVFNGNNDSVSLGQVVRVTGQAGEYYDQTQISNVTSIVDCGSMATVASVDITLPLPSADYLERYEGMLVRLSQTLYVTEHYQLGRYGQIVMSANGRLQQPTNVVAPGAPALALQAANDLDRILVDDALTNQNPDPILFGDGGNPLTAGNTLRGGDTATNMVGILGYGFGSYVVYPTHSMGGGVPDFVPANPRPASPPDVGGSLRVAGMNLLNFFNTFGTGTCTLGVGGAPTDCRGADDMAEFDRQWPKTVAAIVGTNADVIGILEIENDGYGPDSVIQFLVDKLNEATAPGAYAFIDADAGTGQVNALGVDAIKVGLLYKPASVTPVGTTAVLNTPEFVTGGDSADRNRPSLAQAFEQVSTGARFVVDINHLKSKGSACDAPDAGDGQSNCNIVRTNAANLLTAWLASDPTGINDPDVLILGDLNSYAMEDPITAIKNAGYTNLIYAYGGNEAYSYVFDGQWGYLDHALGSSGLTSQATGVAEWHINADEPSVLDYNTNYKSPDQITSLYSPDEYRVSDHDPVLVGLDLDRPMEIKEDTRDNLAMLLPTGDSQTDHRIEKAIDRIDQSLDPHLWETDLTLHTKMGKKVFDWEQQAVHELLKVVDDNAQFASAAQAAIDQLVEADRQLAQIALIAAIDAGGDAQKIAQAQSEMAQAADAVVDEKFDKAIEHYRKAWMNAVLAIEK
jgi:predicted extracellular nuclease